MTFSFSSSSLTKAQTNDKLDKALAAKEIPAIIHDLLVGAVAGTGKDTGISVSASGSLGSNTAHGNSSLSISVSAS